MGSVKLPRVGLKFPLSLVVGRYFLYVLLGALFAMAVPWSVFTWQLNTGAVLPADYAEKHLEEVKNRLVIREGFKAEEIPSAYRYALWDEHGSLLASDMDEAQRKIARDLVFSPRKTPEAVSYPGGNFVSFSLAKGNKCVLSYHLMPQWANKNLRDGLPNPQNLYLIATVAGLTAIVGLTAWRAGLVLGEKMWPLTEVARAVGRQDFTQTVSTSNVVEIDRVLRAMEQMRDSLYVSLTRQQETERQSREQVAALAHDLKTPLTVVLGNLELLTEDAAAGKLDAEQVRCLQAAHESALTMSEFVDVIVQTTLGQSQGLNIQPIALGEWLDRLEHQAQNFSATRGITLETSRCRALSQLLATSTDKQPHFRGDALALQRAVLNLVDNAGEHSRGRQVRLKFSVSSEAAFLVICVEDDGTGFSPLALQRGCERFFRDDISRGATGGTAHFGLGLAVVAEVVRAHGGVIELSNLEDRQGNICGARVKLSLPLMNPTESPNPNESTD